MIGCVIEYDKNACLKKACVFLRSNIQTGILMVLCYLNISLTQQIVQR